LETKKTYDIKQTRNTQDSAYLLGHWNDWKKI